MPRYLTKSRFKLASECPTKLFYTAKRDVYADRSYEDSFMKVLADGGFQVGELPAISFAFSVPPTGSVDIKLPIPAQISKSTIDAQLIMTEANANQANLISSQVGSIIVR